MVLTSGTSAARHIRLTWLRAARLSSALKTTENLLKNWTPYSELQKQTTPHLQKPRSPLLYEDLTQIIATFAFIIDIVYRYYRYRTHATLDFKKCFPQNVGENRQNSVYNVDARVRLRSQGPLHVQRDAGHPG
jgi:hypothetical protein